MKFVTNILDFLLQQCSAFNFCLCLDTQVFYLLLEFQRMEEGNSSLQSLIPSSGGGGENLGKGNQKREIKQEVKKQLWLAGPLIGVSVLQYSLQVISVMFVGHLGELALSSASLATSFATVTGFSLLLGMGSALDTLCGQAYGANQYRLLGVYMQRAIFVLIIVSIPLSVIWAYMGSILVCMGQDPEISMEAQLYARWMIPSLFAYGALQCNIKFLQAQNNVFPMMLSSGITTLFHILVCWLLVFKSGLGSKGAALSNAISYWINVVLLMLYIKFSPTCRKTWTGLSKEAFREVIDFLRLAIPSAVMVCIEYWSFEMVVLLSGLLPNPKLEMSVLSISPSIFFMVLLFQDLLITIILSTSVNTMWMVYMIPFGLSGALSTRVSNELGGGHPHAARLALYVTFVMTVAVGAAMGLITILVRKVWGCLYSNEEEVVKYISTMMPVLAISNFIDGIQCVLSGTARGCGWQKICAFVNLGAYYGVGIPCAILFAFVFHLRGEGLWLGIICGLLVQVLLLLIITLRTNWEQEAKKARDRVYDSSIPIDMAS
ncbi:protein DETOXIFICATION 16 isoform X1 [Cinnamomum micranthum f. kanehirae]|uniref:Protein DETOXIFICATION n=1 Tax=Cinnamomum micranthum f. kanehirae TaxID=337451 RepID=A0A443PJ85_9MAGN|nr:protein DETOXIFICATION 16 isoform X1 [Cinnamomum micranthum f. kanehirae]